MTALTYWLYSYQTPALRVQDGKHNIELDWSPKISYQGERICLILVFCITTSYHILVHFIKRRHDKTV